MTTFSLLRKTIVLTRTYTVHVPKVEIELGHVMQERNDFSNQLLNVERKKEILNDELLRSRHRIEQVGEANARVNKHLEGLVKECEEKQVKTEEIGVTV